MFEVSIEVEGAHGRATYEGPFIPGDTAMDLVQRLLGLLGGSVENLDASAIAAAARNLSGPEARALRTSVLSHYIRSNPKPASSGGRGDAQQDLSVAKHRNDAYAGNAIEGLEAAVLLMGANGFFSQLGTSMTRNAGVLAARLPGLIADVTGAAEGLMAAVSTSFPTS